MLVRSETSDYRPYKQPAVWNEAESRSRLVRKIKATQGHIVVNTSWGGTTSNASVRLANTYDWLEKLRGDDAKETRVPLESKFVHIASAGNDGASILTHYPFSMAAFLAPALGVDSVQNMLVVENRGTTAQTYPGCLVADSNYGETLGSSVVSAVGLNTLSFTTSVGNLGYASGTSQAAPQVSGLAAYIWAVNPSLTVYEVLSIIKQTAYQPTWTESNCPRKPAPVIDAYAAVLAADHAVNKPVRRAILDVNDDDIFDHEDIRLYVNAFSGNEINPARDFSRFDLNGDGYTGGDEKKARFDLDSLSVLSLSPPGLDPYTILEHPCSRMEGLDEERLTDEDILCYYAFSELYRGDQTERDVLLASISPNWIVYTATPLAEQGNANPSRHIWIMSADGQYHVKLTDGAVVDSQPVLSPDRKTVTFSRSGGIYSVKTDGSELFVETTNGTSPGWTPDGTAVTFSRGTALRMLPVGSTNNDGAFLGTGSNLQWDPNRSRYFYSRAGALLSKSAPWGREQIVSIAAGAMWAVSPDGKVAHAVEREGHDPAVPNGPARLIWVDVVARLAAEPTQQEVSLALAASLAQEVLVGEAGQALAEHCHPDNNPKTDECPNVPEMWISGDSFQGLEVSKGNDKVLFQRIKAAPNDHSFVDSDFEAIRATGLGLQLIGEAWTQAGLIPGSSPPQYQISPELENPRWDNDMSVLYECLTFVCRIFPGADATAADYPSAYNSDVVDARLD